MSPSDQNVPRTSQPRHPVSRATIVFWILTVAWLPAGFLFQANWDHFGWGFFPFLVWMNSFPFVALAAGVAALAARIEHGRPAMWICVAWLVLALVYLLVTVARFGSPAFLDWFLERD